MYLQLDSESSHVGALPDNEISISSNIIDEVDIFLFNSPNPSLEIKRNLIWMQNNYPENGVFLFEGYAGSDAKDQLLSTIKKNKHYYKALH